MKSIKFSLLLIFLLLFSLSCAALSRSITNGVGFGGATTGFFAEAPPYGSVKLKWDAVEGAQIYLLEQQLDGQDDFSPVMAFSGVQTNYEDFLAPKNSKLTYRLQSFTDGKPGGYSTASVTTAAILPNPLTVQATFAEDQMVTQSIGPEGGNMSLTDQNGVLYELQVPASSVQAATDFTLTPVIDVEGWPLDGPNLGSVRIGPEGFDLYDNLTLTITLPDGFPEDGTLPVGYGFDGTGDEFHIFPAGITADGTSTQTVKKAGTQGVGTGSKLKIIEFVVGHWVTQFGVNLNQLLVAQQLADADLPPLPTDFPATANAIFQNTDALHIQREMNNILAQVEISDKENITDCASAINWYENTSDLFEQAGNPANSDYFQSTNTQELMGSLNDALTNVINDGISECENSQPGKPPAEYSCLQKLVTKLQIDSNKPDGQFTFPNGDFNLSDLQGFLETLKTSCSSPAYRMPQAAAFGGTLSPDPICDLTQPFSFTMNMSGVDMIMTWTPPGTFQQHVSVEGCTGDFNGTYTSEVSEDGSFVTLTLTIPEVTVSCPDTPGLTFPIPPSPTTIELVADPTASCP
jgi:hypothetical protein